MKIRMSKTFLDLNKEEKWLNQQGKDHLMLVGYHHGVYEFEDMSPVTFSYKIDIPNYSGSKRKDYLDFLDQSGISVVAEYGGRVYLRKKDSEDPLVLYSQKEDMTRQSKKRFSHFITIGISEIFLGLLFLMQMIPYMAEKSTPFWILSLFGAICLLAGLAFRIYGIKGRRRYAPPTEKLDLWES